MGRGPPLRFLANRWGRKLNRARAEWGKTEDSPGLVFERVLRREGEVAVHVIVESTVCRAGGTARPLSVLPLDLVSGEVGGVVAPDDPDVAGVTCLTEFIACSGSAERSDCPIIRDASGGDIGGSAHRRTVVNRSRCRCADRRRSEDEGNSGHRQWEASLFRA